VTPGQRGDPSFELDTYPNPVEYYLLTPYHLIEQVLRNPRTIVQVWRTFDNCIHVSNETMDDTRGLCSGHPSLLLGQSIQSLENCLYLALPKQLFGEFLYGTLSHGQYKCDSALTEPPLFNLFRSQGKHRKKFEHYFDDHLRHYRSWWNRRIYLQTFEEVPQVLEQVDKAIITRRNSTSSLANTFIIGEPVEKRIQETYRKESIDASKQSDCWWKRDLTTRKSH
jgi:hypothetical protein